MNHTVHLLILLSIMTSSCNDIDPSNEVDPWDLNEGYNIEFKYGFYKSSVEIIEDTCSPSLKNILDTTALWPPPYSVMTSGIAPPSAFTFIPFNIRAGSITLVTELPSRNGKIRSKDSMTIQMPDNNNPNFIQNAFSAYCIGLNKQDYSSTVTIRSISADKFEIETEDEWTGFSSCDHDLAMKRHAWFPQAPCREKYKTVYTLHEELPRTCTEAYQGGSSKQRPVDPQNTAPYPAASYYPSFTKEDIDLNCNHL